MKLMVLCCEVFHREICMLAAESPHTCDLRFLPKGLHDLGTERMQARLQEPIDAAGDGYDAIALVYGLCNNGTQGIRARHTRLVIPKAHDCITLFLGGRARYLREFNSRPGTYYRTTGWIERADDASAGETTISQKLGLSLQYDELVRQYGEDNAKYLMETMGDTRAHYDRIAFIRMGLTCEPPFRETARQEAEEQGWQFEELEGDLGLLRKLVNGTWDDDFVIVPPGGSLIPTHNDDVVTAAETAK